MERFTSLLVSIHGKIIQDHLGRLYHLDQTLCLLRREPTQTARVFGLNIQLVKGAMSTTPAEVEIIRRVSLRMEDDPCKSVFRLLEQTISSGRQIVNLAKSAADPGARFYRPGLETLARMMTEGWWLKVDGLTPTDEDERSNRTILGHTLGANNACLDIHFCVGHLIERVVTEGLKDTTLQRVAQHKDWLLNIMTARVCLDGVIGSGAGSKLLEIWRRPRPEGLGWISDVRLQTYIFAARMVGLPIRTDIKEKLCAPSTHTSHT